MTAVEAMAYWKTRSRQQLGWQPRSLDPDDREALKAPSAGLCAACGRYPMGLVFSPTRNFVRVCKPL
jgi:hypothetical protein